MKTASLTTPLRNAAVVSCLFMLTACGGGNGTSSANATQDSAPVVEVKAEKQTTVSTPDFAVGPPPTPETLAAPWVSLTDSTWLEYEVNDDLHVLHDVPKELSSGPAHYENNGDHIEMFNLASSSTNRIEIRTFPTYDSGYRAFDGWFLAESGTDGETIMQIFGSSADNATTAMFRIYDKDGGTLSYYDNQVLASSIYGKWTRLTIAHDANDNGTVTAFINGKQVGDWHEQGKSEHWMKYGAYGSHDNAHPATVYWANVRLYRH